MRSVVRPSKFRNVFGSQLRRDECYDDLRISTFSGVDSSLISVNSTFLAVNWQTTTGNSFAVLPLSQKGRVSRDYPLFTGHTSPVVETAFSPFYEYAIASASDDGRIAIWNLPQDGIVAQSEPALRLGGIASDGSVYGHNRRIQNLMFHPTASDVLASSSADCTVKVWNVNKGVHVYDWEHPHPVVSACFNVRGNLISTTCRDKMIRIFDSRKSSEDQPTLCFAAQDGSHAMRTVFAGDNEQYVISTGSSRGADRQVYLHDMRKTSEPAQVINADKNPGALIPHFDRDCNILYLAAKGDGYFSYYEFEAGQLHFLNAHSTNESLKGIAFAPKRACQTSRTEVMRIYKAHNNWVEQISFIVPRKTGGLHLDLFPPTLSATPCMTADEYFEGKDADPVLVPFSELHLSNQSLNVFAGSSVDGAETPSLTRSNTTSFASPSSNESDSKVRKMSAEIISKDAQITELQNMLAESKALAKKFDDESVARGAKIAKLEAEVAEKQAVIDTVQENDHAKSIRIQDLESEITELKSAFQNIQNKLIDELNN